MTSAGRVTALAILALFALQIVWHGWLAPPVHAAPWVMALLFALPILPALGLLLAGHRRAGFWGAFAALLYFSHGVMAAWVSPDVRNLALGQALVSAVLVVAASWDGLQARFRRRRAPPDV
ncbi:DUF2069 domain-containing protein [Arenimonas sp. MALMAid1274]|uniref:DUF2069 domain-containing protein n=1 Tax=Arenimonas sp. MALMAid1274 TaxID=3411630 RepID=UPI003B9DDCEA